MSVSRVLVRVPQWRRREVAASGSPAQNKNRRKAEDPSARQVADRAAATGFSALGLQNREETQLEGWERELHA